MAIIELGIKPDSNTFLKDFSNKCMDHDNIT